MDKDIFDWGQLPSDWWLQTAQEIGADERHAKFAAAKFRNCSNTEAARLAGYGTGGAESTRSEGYRVSRSNKVTQLLALAAAEAGGGYDGTLTQQEARGILTAMARGSDPAIRIKSIEMLSKMEHTMSAGVDTSKMAPAEHWLVTVLLCTREGGYPPELFIANWALIAIPEHAWWCPLLRQMVPYLKQNLPAIWEIARKHLVQWRPDDLQALEAGPVLSADQIFDIAAKNAGLLLTVIDGAGDVEIRKNAYEELRRIGLIEPMPNKGGMNAAPNGGKINAA